MVRETTNYSQLAQHTQPYWPASEAAQVSIVSLYYSSFLLTTPPPLKEPLKDIYNAAYKEPYSGSLQRRLKEQVINNQTKYRSCPTWRKKTILNPNWIDLNLYLCTLLDLLNYW